MEHRKPRVVRARIQAVYDRLAHGVTAAFGFAFLLVTLALAYELWRSSGLARDKFGWSFVARSVWDPVAGEFGALPFIYGTLVTSCIALLVAVPLGLGVAIFLSELAPRRISTATGMLIDLLAAVPSVIYGLVGLALVVPLMRSSIAPALKHLTGGFVLFSGPAYGVGLLTAGLVLAVMVLPFIVSVSREVLMAVPRDQREAALALGATRWECTWHVVLPFARTGILGAIFLALGRALGETMAVTMVVGNRPEVSASLLAPGYTMAAVLANEFAEATGDLYLHALIEVGLVLFALTIVINGLARGLIAATGRRRVAR